MRQLIQSALVQSDAVKALLGNPPRVYASGSLGRGDIPAIPAFPFVLIMENPSTVNQEIRKGSRSNNRFFQVYCYDEHGTGYERIGQVLRTVRDTLLGLPPTYSPSGALCLDVFWQGNGVDSRDPEYEAGMKFASFKFVTNT